VETKLTYVRVEDIIVPPYRQRRYFDPTSSIELQLSIESDGLINPLALRHDGKTLLAGERRLREIKTLHRLGKDFFFNGTSVARGFVPCTILSPREEEEYFHAEWAENEVRDDLTWQEKTDARARLHRTRDAEHGGGQTASDTVKEIFNTTEAKGYYVTDLKRDLLVSEYLNDPEVAAAKTRKDALKIIELKNRKKFEETYAKELEEKPQESPHTLIIGDSVIELERLQEGSFDCILTDPIYGIGADTFSNKSGTSQTFISHEYSDSYEEWKRLMPIFAREFFRVAKGQAHAYIFCDIRRWEELSKIFSKVGWDVWFKPIIWDKGNRGTLPQPDYGPRYTYEAILFANKGRKPVRRVARDVIPIPTEVKPHFAAEKPVELFKDLLSRTVEPGNTVLDASCGSGTIFPAASLTFCRATGIEINPETANLARIRLSESIGKSGVELTPRLNDILGEG
jgi:site-specific DNA-methyltransferase (adenine-specific)